MMKQLWLTLCVWFSLSMTAQAAEFDIGINDDSILAAADVALTDQATSRFEYRYSDTGGYYAAAGVYFQHHAGAQKIQIGGKLSHLWAFHAEHGTIIGLGGLYQLDLGSNLSAEVSGYYTPSVLAFDAIKRQYEFDTRLQYRLNDSLAVYGGYQYMHYKYESGHDRTINATWYLGTKFKF